MIFFPLIAAEEDFITLNVEPFKPTLIKHFGIYV
jgi:hypothetical protein